MKSVNNLNFMRIHFTWINWSLENQKEFRERIAKASEEERIEIAKHLGLNNAFLIRRNKDVAFRNLIFYKILSDKAIYQKVIPKITEILSRSVMYEGDILKSLEANVPKANIINVTDSPSVVEQKIAGTNYYAIKYLHELLRYYLEREDLENAANVQSSLREYLTSRFYVSDLYKTTFPYEEDAHPVIYEFLLHSFLIENLDNFVYYEGMGSSQIYPLIDLENLFAYPLKERLELLVFQVLAVEESVETFTQYPMLFNNLLSVASILYFKDLSNEEKLTLLNSTFELDDLITLLKQYTYKWDFWTWKLADTYLNRNGFYELALTMLQILMDSYLNYVKEEEKYSLYESLATIFRNLKNYNKAKEYYEEAYKWIDKASLNTFFRDLKDSKQPKPEIDRVYHKGVCLKNLGEIYGHLGNSVKMNEIFAQVEDISGKLEDKFDKYGLYKNLAVAARRMHNFDLEREYLDKALNYIDDTIPIEEVQDLEDRIDTFGETEMSKEKLTTIENKKEIENYIVNGDFLQSIFNFHLSIKFFEKAMNLSQEYSVKDYLGDIYQRLALSYFTIKDWENTKVYLKKSLSIRENFQSELYYFMVLYLTGELGKTKEKLIEIYNLFQNNPDMPTLFHFWFFNIMNVLKKEKFLKLLPLLGELDDKIHEFYLFKFGRELADAGFSELAVQVFEKEFTFIHDVKIQATIYNDIGGVYSDLGDHNKAIEYIKKAIELDEEYDFGYRNLAQIYARMLDYENARKTLKKSIKIAQKVGRPNIQIQSYKEELREFNIFWKSVINTFKISSNEIKNILKTSERKFIDYHGKGDDFDASDIIIEYSKAMEKILNDRVASHFSPLIEKFKNKFQKEKTSNDFNQKFGWLMEKKLITLGKWERIIDDFKEPQQDPDLEEFRLCLRKNFNNQDLDIIQNACQAIVDVRNKIAHSDVLTIKQVTEYRKNIIPLINKIIEILY